MAMTFASGKMQSSVAISVAVIHVASLFDEQPHSFGFAAIRSGVDCQGPTDIGPKEAKIWIFMRKRITSEGSEGG